MNRLIVALDLPDLDEAVVLARALAGHVAAVKVGLELFGAHGPAAVHAVARHAPVFLDLKLHDIPTTVERAARQLALPGVVMVTAHASGGPAMLAAARAGLARAAGDPPLLLAVTVLTSTSDAELDLVGQPAVASQVPRLARLAVGAGADGVVCAPGDLARTREAVGPTAVVVVPGIRPPGADADDHARAATPEEAVAAGADYLVVGRPITGARDPVRAARSLLAGVP